MGAGPPYAPCLRQNIYKIIRPPVSDFSSVSKLIGLYKNNLEVYNNEHTNRP